MKKSKAPSFDAYATSVFEGMSLDRTPLPSYPTIKTGISVLDNYVMKGGLRTMSMVELHGDDSSGKTFFCTWMAAQAQAQYPDRGIVWIDSENSFNKDLAEQLGLDTDSPNFLYYKSSSVEKTFAFLMEAMQANLVLVVWDSVGNSDSSTRLDDPTFNKTNKQGGQKSEQPGLHAAALTPGMKKLAEVMSDKGEEAPAILIVNQMRDSIGVMFGPKEHTPGGRALKHNMHVRHRLKKRGDMPDAEGEPTGVEIEFKTVRSKLGVARSTDGETHEHARFPLLGISHVKVMAMLDSAVDMEFVQGVGVLKWKDKDGTTHKFRGGKTGAYIALADDEMFDKFSAAFAHYMGVQQEDTEDDEQEPEAPVPTVTARAARRKFTIPRP